MVQHFEKEGHAHYLTFSCHNRLPLFLDDNLCQMFVDCLEEARTNLGFKLWAFVIMPNHIHLLLLSGNSNSISKILHSIKQVSGFRAIQYLKEKDRNIIRQLTIREGTRFVRRFWLAGGGYDRNIYSRKAVFQTIDYIHNNPVRCGLLRSAELWKWSSVRFWIRGAEEPMRMDIPELL